MKRLSLCFPRMKTHPIWRAGGTVLNRRLKTVRGDRELSIGVREEARTQNQLWRKNAVTHIKYLVEYSAFWGSGKRQTSRQDVVK